MAALHNRFPIARERVGPPNNGLDFALAPASGSLPRCVIGPDPPEYMAAAPAPLH